MIVAIVFGLLLFVMLLIGDWYQFTNLRGLSARYGCGISQREEWLENKQADGLNKRFDQNGFLQLPHGMARWFDSQQVIVIRPFYGLFAMRFRTAWPLKGTIDVCSTEQALAFKLVKRMPWSSAILALIWLGLVSLGTLAFLVSFAMDGGFGSAGGLLMGLGVFVIGVLVLAFGLILISLAYKLEDQRLMQVYEELCHALVALPTSKNLKWEGPS